MITVAMDRVAYVMACATAPWSKEVHYFYPRSFRMMAIKILCAGKYLLQHGRQHLPMELWYEILSYIPREAWG